MEIDEEIEEELNENESIDEDEFYSFTRIRNCRKSIVWEWKLKARADAKKMFL